MVTLEELKILNDLIGTLESDSRIYFIVSISGLPMISILKN